MDDISHALGELKEGIDKELAQKSIADFPNSLRNALAAPIISSDDSIRVSKSEKTIVIYEFATLQPVKLAKLPRTMTSHVLDYQESPLTCLIMFKSEVLSDRLRQRQVTIFMPAFHAQCGLRGNTSVAERKESSISIGCQLR